MSGTIHLDRTKGWVAANWIYDFLIDEVLTRCKGGQNRELEERLVGGADEYRFASLEGLQEADLEYFFRAVEDVRQHVINGGEKSFASPEFYPALIRELGELLELF